MTTAILKPNDKVVVKYDTGEYYSDYPSQTILTASRGSTGHIISVDEFKTDFTRRLGKQSLSGEQKQAYAAHFAVVAQALAHGLQYPIRFEDVKPPANRGDLLLSQFQPVALVDGAAVEKIAGAGVLGQVSALFGQSTPKTNPDVKIVWPPAKEIHDQAKFTDMELAIIMSNPKPATWQDIEFVYIRYLSTVPYFNHWYRLKQVVAEAAFDIIDTLHFPKHNHPGYSWEVLADMLEKNDPRKALWYTPDQQEALVVAAQKIYAFEQQQGAN